MLRLALAIGGTALCCLGACRDRRPAERFDDAAPSRNVCRSTAERGARAQGARRALRAAARSRDARRAHDPVAARPAARPLHGLPEARASTARSSTACRRRRSASDSASVRDRHARAAGDPVARGLAGGACRARRRRCDPRDRRRLDARHRHRGRARAPAGRRQQDGSRAARCGPPTRATSATSASRASASSTHAVSWRDIGTGSRRVRVIRIATFAPASRDRVRALAAQAPKVVLDLRGDPGGLLDEAVDTASIFVRKGPHRLVVRRERRLPPALRDEHRRSRRCRWPCSSIGRTASAAEIVAAAIGDHKRGAIVGTRTFGKGSLQSVEPLANGAALKLTIAEYRTPKGRDLHGRGVLPTIPSTREHALSLALRRSAREPARPLSTARWPTPGAPTVVRGRAPGTLPRRRAVPRAGRADQPRAARLARRRAGRARRRRGARGSGQGHRAARPPERHSCPDARRADRGRRRHALPRAGARGGARAPPSSPTGSTRTASTCASSSTRHGRPAGRPRLRRRDLGRRRRRCADRLRAHRRRRIPRATRARRLDREASQTSVLGVRPGPRRADAAARALERRVLAEAGSTIDARSPSRCASTRRCDRASRASSAR